MFTLRLDRKGTGTFFGRGAWTQRDDPTGRKMSQSPAACEGITRSVMNTPDILLLVATPCVVLLLASSQTGMNEHVRYAFGVLPFVFVLAGGIAGGLPRTVAARAARRKSVGVPALAGDQTSRQEEEQPSESGTPTKRRMTLALAWNMAAAALLAWSVTSSLWVYPHSLSYFNELVGGPKNGYWHLVSSNIEWGQDLLYLKRWLDAHPEAVPVGLLNDLFFLRSGGARNRIWRCAAEAHSGRETWRGRNFRGAKGDKRRVGSIGAAARLVCGQRALDRLQRGPLQVLPSIRACGDGGLLAQYLPHRRGGGEPRPPRVAIAGDPLVRIGEERNAAFDSSRHTPCAVADGTRSVPATDPVSPLLTVIIPVYNEGPTLDELVRRVEATPYLKEIIVVDDGSRDKTADVLTRWEGRDGIVVLRHAHNRGKVRRSGPDWDGQAAGSPSFRTPTWSTIRKITRV